MHGSASSWIPPPSIFMAIKLVIYGFTQFNIAVMPIMFPGSPLSFFFARGCFSRLPLCRNGLHWKNVIPLTPIKRLSFRCPLLPSPSRAWIQRNDVLVYSGSQSHSSHCLQFPFSLHILCLSQDPTISSSPARSAAVAHCWKRLAYAEGATVAQIRRVGETIR